MIILEKIYSRSCRIGMAGVQMQHPQVVRLIPGLKSRNEEVISTISKYCLFNNYISPNIKPIDCFISILYDDLYQLQERNRAAKELFHIVSSDLREVPAEELSSVLEYLTKQMLDNVKVSKCSKE